MTTDLSDPYIARLLALGHPGRLAVFRLLVRRLPDRVPAGELAEALSLKPSTLSVYVSILARCGLIRSERAGRSVLYRADMDRMGDLLGFIVDDCCQGRPEVLKPITAQSGALLHQGQEPGSIENVLFVSTGNAARSIFAEAILERAGEGRFKAFSAGTMPEGAINPLALSTLQQAGHDIARLRPKNIAEFLGRRSLQMDFVFTLSDQAANAASLPLPGRPVSSHWGLPSLANDLTQDPAPDPTGDPTGDPAQKPKGDPAAEATAATNEKQASPAETAKAFQKAYETLHERLTTFMALPMESLDRISLQMKLDALGRKQEP